MERPRTKVVPELRVRVLERWCGVKDVNVMVEMEWVSCVIVCFDIARCSECAQAAMGDVLKIQRLST